MRFVGLIFVHREEYLYNFGKFRVEREFGGISGNFSFSGNLADLVEMGSALNV